MKIIIILFKNKIYSYFIGILIYYMQEFYNDLFFVYRTSNFRIYKNSNN